MYALQGLGFSYGEQPVLADIDLNLEPGRFYGVIGPNGSGKTTLLDILCGHQPPHSGAIYYKGRSLARYSKKALSRAIALVPQNFYINFPFTGEQIVMMGRYPHIPRFSAPGPKDREKVAEIMKATETEPFRQRLVTRLSGGERQRLIFARALVQETPVLILDEATSNLDIGHTLRLLTIALDRVNQQEKTVISVFQDINLAARFCHALICMRQGRLIAVGPTEQVLTPAILADVFDVPARVRYEPYVNAYQVLFKA